MNDYEPGNVLEVRFTPHTDSKVADTEAPGKYSLSLRIVKPFTPFTMSATMQVELVSTNGCESALGETTSFVLKLYDRRATKNMREEGKPHRPYDPNREADYQGYLTDPSREPTEHSQWGPPDADDELAQGALFEDWLGWYCQGMYTDELAVYRNLMNTPTTREGGGVPYFLGQIELDSPIGIINGILIENISPSVTVKDFVDSRALCGRFDSQLASVFEMAISALDSCHEAQVINRDIKAFNVLVRLSGPWKSDSAPDDADCPLPLGCVIIDFGCARTRQPTETDMEWARAKQWQREEFQLAYYMADVFQDALLAHECEVHHSACRSVVAPAQSHWRHVKVNQAYGTVTYPFWSYKHHNRFRQVDTEEQQKLLKLNGHWGTYSGRPYPETLADVDPVKYPNYEPLPYHSELFKAVPRCEDVPTKNGGAVHS